MNHERRNRATPEILTVNGAAFSVLRLLGHGKGGYSYLVTDGKSEFVLKQIHHEPCDYYTFSDKLQSELHDYETLRALGIPMPALFAVDRETERLLKEYLPGPTVKSLLIQGQFNEDWLFQLRAMCKTLYPAGLNIDYYPTNFVVVDRKLYYVDYECNPYDEKWDFAHWGLPFWTESLEKGR